MVYGLMNMEGGHVAVSLCTNLLSHHPLSFVGALGIGPKYLLDEYAVLDTRYWVLKDPVVAWVSYQEFFIMAPLSYMW